MTDDKDHPNATATPEEVSAYFLALHENTRQCMLYILERQAAEASSATSPKQVFSVGVDDFPEEVISLEDITFLTTTIAALSQLLGRVPPPTEDARAAAAVTVHRFALSLARSYLNGLALFLAADRRYHPDAPIEVHAHGAFDVETASLRDHVECLSEMSRLAGVLFPDVAQTVIPNELRVLQLSASLYFNTLDTIFALRAIRKCRIAFDSLMRTIGTPQVVESAASYIRRHKTMYREIAAWQTHGGQVNDAATHQAVSSMTQKMEELRQTVDACKDSVDAAGRAVAKMDRRQTRFLKQLKVALYGFIKLFRPGNPTPTRETVHQAFRKPPKTAEQKRYACLERVGNEAHKQQLKAVIDYTCLHPIVYEGTNGDDLTLSNAVRAVWNAHQKEWEKLADAYDSFEKLKAACYNLRNKSDDPFTYQTR